MNAVTDPTRPADTIPRHGEDLHSGGRPSAPVTDRYLGVTFARQAADIVARTEGRLDAVYVSLGDHLRAGDIIARIEPSAIIQQLSIAESFVRSAEAEEKSARLELEEAEDRYSRLETLAEAGILSREELASARVLVERAKNQLEVARARVSEQIARVDEAKESLAHTQVRASFTGTVSVRFLDPGATVKPGVPIINLTRSSDVWVRVAIPQTKAVTIEPGTAISFTPDGLHVAIPGVVEHKAPGLSSAAQELLIEAKLNAPARYSEWVKPGATGVVSLPDTGSLTSTKEGVASLPAIPSLPEGRR